MHFSGKQKRNLFYKKIRLAFLIIIFTIISFSAIIQNLDFFGIRHLLLRIPILVIFGAISFVLWYYLLRYQFPIHINDRKKIEDKINDWRKKYNKIAMGVLYFSSVFAIFFLALPVTTFIRHQISDNFLAVAIAGGFWGSIFTILAGILNRIMDRWKNIISSKYLFWVVRNVAIGIFSIYLYIIIEVFFKIQE